MASAAAAAFVKEVIPKPLNSTSEPPPIFDGTTRLYVSLRCPYAQCVWFLRNYKGLQDKIKLVPINLADRPAWYKEKVYPTNRVPALEHNNEVIGDIGETLNLLKYTNTNGLQDKIKLVPINLANRPAWYKEKVYPENKVPALEHNNKVIGESLELLKYIESNFEGPALLPNEPAKQEFAEELFTYTDTLNKIVFTSFKAEDPAKEASVAFDHLEAALSKFDDGPFFLGQFSLVDIAYVPFIERFEVFFKAQYNYDITAGRPKLAEWIKELNKIEAYTVTKTDPEELVKFYKARFVNQ